MSHVRAACGVATTNCECVHASNPSRSETFHQFASEAAGRKLHRSSFKHLASRREIAPMARAVISPGAATSKNPLGCGISPPSSSSIFPEYKQTADMKSDSSE
eukprot:4785534-Pleurochrysis_carterae.AAC.1